MEKQKLVYWIKVEKQNEAAFNGVVSGTQRALWRKNSTKVVGLPSMIFFSVLLKSYGVMATDCLQTEDGSRFWNIRVMEALKKDFHVYVLNENVKSITKIVSLEEFDKLADSGKIWGTAPVHKNIRVLISEKLLSPSPGYEFDD